MFDKEWYFPGESADDGPGVLRPSERQYLRELARRWKDLCQQSSGGNAEKIELWKRHNALRPTRPLLLVFPEGGWTEIVPEDSLISGDPFWRRYECYLRREVFRLEHFQDDTVPECVLKVRRVVRNSGWGMSPRRSYAASGMWKADPPLKRPEDIEALRPIEYQIDHAETDRRLTAVGEAFADRIPVAEWVNYADPYPGIIPFIIRLRGQEQLLFDMIERPDWVHRLSAFLQRAILTQMDRFEQGGKLAANNGNHYVGTGGIGYTDELPSAGYDGRMRYRDLWGHAQSQDYTCVSPAMYKEFALDYLRPILARFGLTCYGCCEVLDDKFDAVKEIANLRRVSVGPLTNVERAAEALGRRYVFSWKPNPAHLIGSFNEERVEAYIRHTLEVTRGCCMEMILKDTHSCEGHPERFAQWLNVARRACARAGVGD